LKLKWKDIDFPSRIIRIDAMNSKTARERKIGMTKRVFQEFQGLWSKGDGDTKSLVFGIKDNFKNGFANALEDAGIEGFRFHDLRHTAITRLVNAGVPPMEIMKVSGHSQWTTCARYVNPTTDAIRQNCRDSFKLHSTLRLEKKWFLTARLRVICRRLQIELNSRTA